MDPTRPRDCSVRQPRKCRKSSHSSGIAWRVGLLRAQAELPETIIGRIVPQDGVAKAWHTDRTAPLATVLIERTVRVAIAKMADERVVALDIRQAGLRIPIAELVANSESELIGMGRSQLVVDQIDFVRRPTGLERRQPFRGQICGVPRVTMLRRIDIGGGEAWTERSSCVWGDGKNTSGLPFSAGLVISSARVRNWLRLYARA